MVTNTLNNNKLFGIKLAFAAIHIILFYIAKLHIEYQFGVQLRLVLAFLVPVLYMHLALIKQIKRFVDIATLGLFISLCFYYLSVFVNL